MSIEGRITDLLKKMSAEEKVAQLDMIRGSEYIDVRHAIEPNAVPDEARFNVEALAAKLGQNGIGFIHDSYSTPKKANELQKIVMDISRLHIPAIFTGEGLHGIAFPGASVFPTPLCLAASFDTDLIHMVGKQIGAETRALGMHNIFAPNLDMGREPRWGRTEETFGEDTYLSSQMAYAIVTGEQGNRLSDPDAIISEVKHYCGHGVPEGGLNCAPTHAGVREMETEYLPVFESAVKDAGAWAVMASYNCVDGEPMIASDHYLNEILRNRYGLRGFVRADFGAVKRLATLHHLTDNDEDSICMAFNNGLDVQGFDFPNDVWQGTLLKLLEQGKISEERLDQAVSRVLRVKMELGLFDKPFTDETAYKQIVRGELSKTINQKAAEEGLVLLKNDGLLPFSPDSARIAVIGPGANTQRIGGYSSKPYGYEIKSVVEELHHMLPGADIQSVDGCGITDYDFMPMPKKWFNEGVSLTFYDNLEFKGEPVGHEKANRLYFNWAITKPHSKLPMQNYGVRFEGTFTVDKASAPLTKGNGTRLGFKTVDGIKLWVDGKLVIESCGNKKIPMPECEFEFVDGSKHSFIAEFECDMSGNEFALGICTKGKQEFERAKEVAKTSDAVIVIVGDDTSISGECRDRNELKLYGKQSELIKAVADSGRPFALVLVNGRPADLSYESSLANAIMVAWYGGEFGAKAIAKALFGKTSPCGHLPISFPRSVGSLPDYYCRLPGKNTHYIEGKPDALYTFGHGLTYTTFEYSDLTREADPEMHTVDLKFKIKNTGDFAATAVPQVYVRDECSSVVTPMRLLKGFTRVELKSGETRCVSITLDDKAFRLFNLRHEWVIEPGYFEIMIGESADDIRLQDRISWDM